MPKGIYKRKPNWDKILTKKFLIKEYIKTKKGIPSIAKEIGCSVTPISNRLKKCNIKIRTKTEAGKFNNKYIDGRKKAKHYCIELGCHNEISYPNWLHGNGRCQSCAIKGERNVTKNKKVREKIGQTLKGHKASEESKRKRSLTMGGTGIPYEFTEYGSGFDSTLKEQIRFRDGYKCQICGCSQLENGRQLDVHHKDYNKKNLNWNNLISLCRSCHMKTNFNRDYWYAYFNYIMEKING